MNTLLNNILNDINTRSSKLSPVKESGDVYSAEFELAGFSKKDVDIKVNDNTLTIEAKNEDRQKSFKLFLYDLVSEDHITASLKNGLLKITLPKKAVSETKKIDIK
tara:strand:+ start:2589 stop:2906 length:318 start_codon:yes stop_codon:yes gene_type:complete